jgi:hypothetical protein
MNTHTLQYLTKEQTKRTRIPYNTYQKGKQKEHTYLTIPNKRANKKNTPTLQYLTKERTKRTHIPYNT